MATQDPKTDPQVEEKEEKDGPSLISNFVQMIILFLEFISNFFCVFRKFNQTN